MGLKDQFFDERISTSVAVHPGLPFFHSCEAVHLQSILDDLSLQPGPCKVYGEDLLYLFYGKPAYKSSNSKSTRHNFLMPLCFMVNYDAVTTIKRSVAFDSGAFDRYADHFHESMKREEFHLTPTKATLNKIVDFFFAGNDPYFHGEAKRVLPPYDKIHYQVDGYHSLLTSNEQTDVDDRRGTIEVQIDYPLELNSSNIEVIILPKHLQESAEVKHILDPLGIPTIGILNYGVMSRNYYVYILDKVREWLINKKLLNV